MSNIAIKGAATGTAVFTLESPTTNTNRTLTLPDVTATVITDSAGVLNIGSGQVYKDASGNLGIGTTTSDGAKLKVAGGILATGAFSSTIGSSGGIDYSPPDGLRFFSNGTSGATKGSFTFVAKGADDSSNQAMTLTANGDLLVGTTTNTDFSTALTVVSAGARVASAKGTGGSSTWVSSIWNTGTSGTRNLVQFFTDTGQSRGDITSNGTGVSYNTSSDYRLKEDCIAVANASTRVNALKPVNFAWKADGSRVDGFLAHELAEVVPEAVTGSKDAVDADGKPEYQGIDQSKLVPLLTAALQEALARIETLEADVATLKGAA